MNTILALQSDKHNNGKTTTLTIFRNLLLTDKTYIHVPGVYRTCKHDSEDFIDLFTKNGLTIGISTVGDSYSLIKEYVDELMSHKCNIVFTASGTTRYKWGRDTIMAIETYVSHIQLYKLKTVSPTQVAKEDSLTNPENLNDAQILHTICEQLVR